MSQSSNDVIPSALHVAAAQAITEQPLPSLTALAATIRAKGRQYQHVVKTGRTHLMDALPIRFELELGGWAAQIDDNIVRLQTSLQHLLRLPLGGTAVGSGVNCHPRFAERARFHLARLTGLDVQAMTSNYLGLSCLDTVLETSGQLKTCAATLMKIANDLRWMNSGPGSGLGEISLPALQPGSSIMPDKVNPVIAEAVCMAAARVIGNDASITIAAQSGNFQLNTMLPLAAADVLESIALIGGAARDLGDKAIGDLTVREERLREPLAKNPILVTALAPYIGYLPAAAIAKTARQQQRTILDVAREMTDLAPELLERLLDPVLLADGGSPPTDDGVKRREG
jgi:fumarate hydratase class II